MKFQLFRLNNLFKAVILLLLLANTACYKDNEQTMYPSNCNTTNVTFSQTISPIINNNCVSCHSGGINASGGLNLTNYDEILVVVNNGKLLGSIRHDAGFKEMPQGSSPLSDCSISQVDAWITQGALNN
jgi:hypothetical protein